MPGDSRAIGVGTLDGGLYLHVRGESTRAVCATADRVAGDFLATQPPTPRITIDLAGSDWVDSTFAGWLAGVYKRLGETRERVRLLHCSKGCRGSLERMRLAALFTFPARAAPPALREVPLLDESASEQALHALMLRAHEELALVDDENARIFKPIADMLRRRGA